MTQEERKARAEARKAANRARWEQEKQDRAIVADALRAVIADDAATPAQRLFAVTCLNYSMGYHIVPYDLKYPDSRGDSVNADLKL